MTNNIAEEYVLYLSLKLARDHRIHKLRVLSDSVIIIMADINNYSLENNFLMGVMQRIKSRSWDFEEFKLHHVKRNLNSQDDLMAKEASRKLQRDFF